MALSKSIAFEKVGDRWQLVAGSPVGHERVVSILYGGVGQALQIGDGDREDMIDLFAVFGFAVRFVGGTTDVA